MRVLTNPNNAGQASLSCFWLRMHLPSTPGLSEMVQSRSQGVNPSLDRGPLHPCVSPSLGWGRHRGHSPAQTRCSQHEPAAPPSIDTLLPAGTHCRRWKRQHPSAAPAPLLWAIQGTVLLCTENRADCPQGWQKILWGLQLRHCPGRQHSRAGSVASCPAVLPSPGLGATRLLLRLDPSWQSCPGTARLRDQGLSRRPRVGHGAQPCQQPLGRAWRSPRPPWGAGGSVPAPQPSRRAPIPSAAHAWDVFGGRTLALPGILVGLRRAAGRCGAMRGRGCQGCRP